MYAYGIRGLGNPELHRAFEQRLEQIADRLDYPSMFNVIYYLLFRESTNEIIWRKIVDNTLNQTDVLPLIYYTPFKMSKLWLRQKFPDWDLQEYVDKFYNAERYYDVTKLERNFFEDGEYLSFKKEDLPLMVAVQQKDQLLKFKYEADI